jgi:glyoxylase-like metal-dependent hydrolase (beta-lactamase superfamily II)/rhodanese-related sulfurtransferase
MILRQLFDPISCTYTYLLAARKGGEALIIDPVKERIEDYLKIIAELDLKLLKAIDTHVHADHFSALGDLRNLTHCMTIMGAMSSVDLVSMRVEDGESIDVDGLNLRTIYTPGHTDDSYCFYMPGYVFTGDTLLIRGCGRTDFQNGDPEKAYESITKKLFTLPDETNVYPGHDYKGENVSTIGREKRDNPRLAGKTKDEFIQIMNNLNLPNPKLMDLVIPANLNLGGDLQRLFFDKQSLAPSEFLSLMQDGTPLLIDLRESHEAAKVGSLSGAEFLPYQEFINTIDQEKHIVARASAENLPILLFCAFGERSGLALKLLNERGFQRAFHLSGGLSSWIKEGLPVTPVLPS